MARKTFLYYLFSSNKKPLYVNDAGHVQEGTDNYMQADNLTPAHLKYEPNGWKDVLVKFARNVKFWGMFRSFTVSMKFSKDGARILRDQDSKKGILTLLYFGMLKLDKLTLPYTYKSWYFSELNFAKYKDIGTTVAIEALEGGITKYLKAFEATVFTIPVDKNLNVISVYNDGTDLDNTATYLVDDGINADLVNFYSNGNHLVNLSVTSKEIEDIGGAFDVARTKVDNNDAHIKATGKYFFKATSSVVIKLSFDFILTTSFDTSIGGGINPGADLYCMVRRIEPSGSSTFILTLLHRTTVQGIVGQYHIQLTDQLVPVSTDDELYLYTFLLVEGVGGDVQMTFVYSGDQPFMNMVYTTRFQPTSIPALSHLELANQLVSFMSSTSPGKVPGIYTSIKSDFLTSIQNSWCIFSGDSARVIPNSTITISFDDFFKHIQNRWGLGMGIENDTIVIEPFDYFWRQAVILDLGEIDQVITVERTEDLISNTISAGYAKQTYTEINGREEVNQGQKLKTPITSIIREMDLTSPVRGDMFGIELMRINFSQKATTDSSGDNDTFFLNVNNNFKTFPINIDWTYSGGIGQDSKTIRMRHPPLGFVPVKGMVIRFSGSYFNNKGYIVARFRQEIISGDYIITFTQPVTTSEPNANVQANIVQYTLNRPAYTNVTGLLHPATAYNIEARPKNGILNNGAMLHSLYDNMDAEYITLVSSDKNSNLVTTLNGITIDEKAPIQIGTLKPQLFRAYYLTFTTRFVFNIDVFNILNTNPYGKIRFLKDGNPYYGYLFDGGIAPATNDKQTWKLLCAPENDLTKLYPNV